MDDLSAPSGPDSPNSAPDGGTARSKRHPFVAEVLSTERLTPHMIRVVLGGKGLEYFRAGEFSDHYVKLQLPPPGASYSAPFEPERVRENHPAEHWFRTRTYTVRHWDESLRELTVDFVYHGDTGIAGPWAAAARPGDKVQMVGPGGAYSPDPDAGWHLMAGDEACIPAISASLARVPVGIPVFALIEVEDAGEELRLESSGELRIEWLHRSGRPRTEGDLLLEAVRSLELPAGLRGQAFVHGEAGMVRDVRKHLIVDRGMDRADVSATGYWKYTETEEGWRMYKGEWKRLAELDVDAAA